MKGLSEGACIIELCGGMKGRKGGVQNEGMGAVQCMCIHVLCIYTSVSVSPGCRVLSV